MNENDFFVRFDGSLFLFTPLTESAKIWIEENVQNPLFFGDSLVVEHRYADDLAEGIIADGLHFTT